MGARRSPLLSPQSRSAGAEVFRIRRQRGCPRHVLSLGYFLLGASVAASYTQFVQKHKILKRAEENLWRNQDAAYGIHDLRPKFVLFGDSLTQHSFGEGGWGAALQHLYARKADVVLRGYSGYNSRWCVFLLDKVFPKEGHVPALVTVFLGANDAVLPETQKKKYHVPLEEYKNNLETIVQHVQKLSATVKVILITPPPVDEEARLRHARSLHGDKASTERERRNDITGQYASACKEVAGKMNIPVIDLWTKIQQQPVWKSFLSDGLHLSSKGNGLVFQELKSILAESTYLSPSLEQSLMKWDFPKHSNIDELHPENSFNEEVDHRTALLP